MEAAADLSVALGVGLLLGAERERHKGRGQGRGAEGIRTFALVALLGGLAQRVGGGAAIAVALGVVGLAVVAAYVLAGDEDDPGLTTEIAVVVAFLLGALAQEDAALAAGIAVTVALLLANRSRLHRLVRDAISEEELHDGLLFAAAALVVLPLVPDEPLGPNGAINPVMVWRLVVVVMAVQGFGYVTLRVIGPRYGLLLSGFVSGFVSSTATVASMGGRAAKDPPLRDGAAAAAVASTVATVVFLAVVLGATSTATLVAAAPALVCSGLAAAGYAAFTARRAIRRPVPSPQRGRPFDLRTPFVLAAAVVTVLLVAGALHQALGDRGAALGAAIAGFADSQSAAVSPASLVDAGRLDEAAAVIAVLAALTTNSVSKAVVAAATGGRRFAIEVGVGLVLVVGAAWGAWAVGTLA